MRVAYHRTCIEKVLSKAPLDPAESIEQLNEFRDQLLERYGASQ